LEEHVESGRGGQGERGAIGFDNEAGRGGVESHSGAKEADETHVGREKKAENRREYAGCVIGAGPGGGGNYDPGEAKTPRC
jgi:hypothetical protein